MPDLDKPLDPSIGAHFHDLRGSVTAMVPIPGVDEIVQRGRRRRRNGYALMAGGGVLAVMLVAAALLSTARLGGTPLPPVQQTSENPRYVPPAGAQRDGLGRTIPRGFLPATGSPTTASATGSPTVVPTAPATGPSSGTASGTASGPSAGPEKECREVPPDVGMVTSASSGNITVRLYPNGNEASRALADRRREAQRCGRGITNLTFGGEGYAAETRQGSRVTGVEAVVRYGWALLSVRGADQSAVRVAGDVERRLCVFSNQCQVRGARPAPVLASTAGGEVWAVVVAGSADKDDPVLGQAVAATSTMGYRTSITSAGCDEGMSVALGLAAGQNWFYVPVYFDNRQAAEEFGALMPSSTRIHQVRTYCIV